MLKALGRLDDAQAAYERVPGIAPGHVEALNNVGIVNLELGRKVDASNAFRRGHQTVANTGDNTTWRDDVGMRGCHLHRWQFFKFRT